MTNQQRAASELVQMTIEEHVSEVHRLLFMGALTAPVLQPFREPVFVSLILKLHDLLQILSLQGHRIAFTDDVPSGLDITDLVSKVRNAIAHPSSPENLLGKDSRVKFVFNVINGKGSPLSMPGTAAFSSDYSDDVAYFYGEHRLYLKRHLCRLFKETHAMYQAIYPKDADRLTLRLRF
jgi:hypothetical protein